MEVKSNCRQAFFCQGFFHVEIRLNIFGSLGGHFFDPSISSGKQFFLPRWILSLDPLGRFLIYGVSAF